MKLRFGIDSSIHARIRDTLDGLCEKPPVGRKLSDVYLDTMDGALAAHGVALRFRRVAALGVASPGRPWRRQTVWRKGTKKGSIKKFGIQRLRQRLDATFDVRIERWTWEIDDGWAKVSLDRSEVSSGSRREHFDELRVVCRKKRHADALAFAVQLGAAHLASGTARERGMALIAAG